MVNQRHDGVKRTIERLAEEAVISLPPLVKVKIQRERRAETVDAYLFEGQKGKRDSLIVVAQLCQEFRGICYRGSVTAGVTEKGWRARAIYQWANVPPPLSAP